jgi:hypothetical protein
VGKLLVEANEIVDVDVAVEPLQQRIFSELITKRGLVSYCIGRRLRIIPIYEVVVESKIKDESL